MADPVSQRFVLKRYHSRPELWQHQSMSKIRPYTFILADICDLTVLYSGTVGSENMDSVDVPGEDFVPLTLLRTTIPPHTPASYRTTIPGYTGKARFDRPWTSGVGLPSLPYTPQTAGSRSGTWSTLDYGHKAPLSGMITTVPPGNPYLHPKAPIYNDAMSMTDSLSSE
ncbi:hypothetical protein cypCar_00039451 [Cyprinus carpio]|nr:hypothetical protein cypCar_00039451 [Cyprinus carpio]